MQGRIFNVLKGLTICHLEIQPHIFRCTVLSWLPESLWLGCSNTLAQGNICSTFLMLAQLPPLLLPIPSMGLFHLPWHPHGCPENSNQFEYVIVWNNTLNCTLWGAVWLLLRSLQLVSEVPLRDADNTMLVVNLLTVEPFSPSTPRAQPQRQYRKWAKEMSFLLRPLRTHSPQPQGKSGAGFQSMSF